RRAAVHLPAARRSGVDANVEPAVDLRVITRVRVQQIHLSELARRNAVDRKELSVAARIRNIDQRVVALGKSQIGHPLKFVEASVVVADVDAQSGEQLMLEPDVP